MENNPRNVTYHLKLDDGKEFRFAVQVDRNPKKPRSQKLPTWAALDFEKCPHCPLSGTPDDVCPAAADIVPIVERFSELTSYTRVQVSVITPERIVHKNTDMQQALSALMGLILGSSACPIFSKLHPMAETHVPFASSQEAIFRLISTHLTGCFFRDEKPSINELKQLLTDIDELNRAFIERLRAATSNDANPNALVILQSRSLMSSLSLEDGIKQIRKWYGLAP